MSNIKAQDVERSIVKKFRKEIWRKSELVQNPTCTTILYWAAAGNTCGK